MKKKTIYDKLVRDNIPEIIEKDGKECRTRVLSDDEYVDYLNRKLMEELREYMEDGTLEELADVQEVIDALAVAGGTTVMELKRIKDEKAKKNGKFDKKILLESVIEDE